MSVHHLVCTPTDRQVQSNMPHFIKGVHKNGAKMETIVIIIGNKAKMETIFTCIPVGNELKTETLVTCIGNKVKMETIFISFTCF